MNDKHNIAALKNNVAELSILTSVGGRTIGYNLSGQPNVLLADTGFAHEAPIQKPSLDNVKDFKAYNGHIVWLGPQSAWWTAQYIHIDKRINADVWPPDPYLIYGNYSVVEQTKNSVVTLGPKSKILGPSIKKNKYSKRGWNCYVYC
ncbi:MAG: DUF4380 domain-containing protein [Bacteroidales bacterium]|nr:DUF4380 domain-containing protein [Bacteroidales bacterium]